jgi:hypothetical protein
MAEIDSVLHDINLIGEVGRDIGRGVRNYQRVFMAGHIHHKAMTDRRAVRRSPARRRRLSAHQYEGCPSSGLLPSLA